MQDLWKKREYQMTDHDTELARALEKIAECGDMDYNFIATKALSNYRKGE